MEFEKNYLQDVIFRVEFRSIQELMGVDANPEKFQNIIKNEFPILEITEETKITQNLGSNSQLNHIDKNKIWTCYDNDYSKKLEVTNYSISLSYNGKKYNSHNPMFDDIELIKQILTIYSVNIINKIGLRYINEVTPNVDVNNWEGWINSKLHNFNSLDDNLKLIRSMTLSEFKINDFSLNIRYGQFNLNYPDIKIENDFVLDYDCISHSLTNIDELTGMFEEMHSIIKYLFCKSIGNELINDMNGDNDD